MIVSHRRIPCSRCREFFTPHDESDLCPRCRHGRALEGRPPADDVELDAWLAQWGAEGSMRVHRFWTGEELNAETGVERWAGYRIEWVMVPVPTPDCPLYFLTPWRWEADDIPMVIVRWRVWQVEAPELLEQYPVRVGSTWEWEARLRWRIRQRTTPRRLQAFLELVQKRCGPGPKTSTIQSRDQVLRTIKQRHHELHGDTVREVADLFGLGRRQFQNSLKLLGLEFRRDIKPLLRG